MRLRLNQLCTGYNTASGEKVLLKPSSVEANPSEVIGILGPNGCGKSTLFRTLSGMLPALSGEIWYGDRQIQDMNLSERARIFSLVPTRSQFPARLTVRELLSWARHSYTDWLGRLGLVDKHIVDQVIVNCDLQELLHRPVAQLSDGERQRVMIARALAQSVSVVFLDEPTAFLDVYHKHRLMQLVLNLSRSQKVLFLLSTHDLELALGTCDKIWLLSDQTLEYGYPEELIDQGILDKVFVSQGVSHRSGNLSISLKGDSEAIKKACKRLGISINQDSILKIETDSSNFSVIGKDTVKRNQSLRDVLGYLESLAR